jgi:hypothetical protein
VKGARPLIVLVLLVSSSCVSLPVNSLQSSPAGYRLDDRSLPSSPYASVRWKAWVIAGDHSIPAFDNAARDVAAMLQSRGVQLVRRFSASSSELSETVLLATNVNLQQVASTATVAAGEGCIVYATAHGTVQGLWLTRDGAKGSPLSPTSLKNAVRTACGTAPTIVVVSGCFSGTYIRPEMVGPNMIVLTAAAQDRISFGCRADYQYPVYDACFLDVFPAATTWQDLYVRLFDCIVSRERRVATQWSLPQAFFGRDMKDLPLPRE